MAAEHSDVPDREERLGAVLVAYLEGVDRGQVLRREELLARYPEFAADLNRFLDDQERVERCAAPLRAVAAAAAGCATVPQGGGGTVTEAEGSRPAGTLRSLGDYELLEEIGRGGMATVYRARQGSLGRTVAVKVIRAADGAARRDAERFRREAELAAHLDHPHIVPVYEVGEQDGYVYFSMKLIEGGSLADDPDRFTADPRAAARLLAAVARAVHHAHQRGVLHRDLKPANVLLDGAGQPHVTDFGLARRVEGDSSLTQSGALVGTPSYMAPEQTTRERAAVTTAADVYGLGTVLYAVLTGRPPFRADTAVDTLLLVREREPEPPRRLNARVDRDLETVCLKCLQKDPQRRYGSAELVAEDLERWLAGKPIQARRIGSWERLGKWVRRRPALAGLVAVSILAVLSLVGGLLWHNAQLQEAAQREHQAAQGERQQAEQARIQRDQAREEREWARQAVKDMYTEVAEKWLEQKPRLQPLQRQFLEKALRYYQRFAEQAGTSPDERLAAADAYRRVADIRLKLGHHQQSIDAYRHAKSILEELAAKFPNTAEYRARLAQVHTQLGVALVETHAFPEAKEEQDQAVRLLRQLVRENPASAAIRQDLAKALGSLGNVLVDGDQPLAADEAYAEALRYLRQLTTESPDNLAFRRDLLRTYHNQGRLYYNTRRAAEAEKAFEKAQELGESLVARQPGDPEYRAALASACSALGLVRLNGGQSTEAEKPLRRAEELLKKLADEFPDVPEYQELLALTEHNLGNLLSENGPSREAEEAYRASLKVKEGMIKAFPQVAVYREDVVQTCINLAQLLREAHRLPEAREVNRRGLEVAEQLVKDFPEDRTFRPDLAYCHERLAEVYQSAGDFREAAAECGRALETCPEDPDIQCTVAWVLATLPAPYGDPRRAVGLARKASQAVPQRSYYWRTLGLAQYHAGDARAAVETLNHALRLEKSAPAHTLLFLSMAYSRLGNRQEARRCYDKAVGYLNQVKTPGEQLRGYRAEAAHLLGIEDQPAKAKEESAPKKK